jgi:lipopolysaccharide transport system ATP-binding protein
MTSLALHVEQVSVSYRRYTHPRDALLEWLWRKPRHTVFHALQHLSFSLVQGQSLGIIGNNGAGKSTLLKLLAGNLSPTQGQCLVHGKRSALLELGAGLQPEFSGLENARLGLALRGLTHAEIKQALPEVLAFAELGEFVQQPIKTYSSGMVVRLVFAIAAVIEPQVLIVDEALSVGDQYFQKKSLDRMRAILSQGASLVFCSHNLYQVREMCEQALWLEQGQLKMLGEAQSVVDAYQDSLRAKASSATLSVLTRPSSHAPQILDVQLNQTEFQTLDRFSVSVYASQAEVALADIHVGIVVRRNDDVQCFGMSTAHDGKQVQPLESGVVGIRLSLEQLPLLSGSYCLEVWLVDKTTVHIYDSRPRCCHFRVQQASQTQGVGVFYTAHQWLPVSTEQSRYALAS